jgi:hypothetical protein
MLTLYRRHTKDCHVNKTRLAPRAKRRYMDCQCPIWMYGRTRDALVPRQSTGTRDLAVAEAQRRNVRVSSSKAKTRSLMGRVLTIASSASSNRTNFKLGEKTAGAYRFQLERLRAYCAGRGVPPSNGSRAACLPGSSTVSICCNGLTSIWPAEPDGACWPALTPSTTR